MNTNIVNNNVIIYYRLCDKNVYPELQTNYRFFKKAFIICADNTPSYFTYKTAMRIFVNKN